MNIYGGYTPWQYGRPVEETPQQQGPPLLPAPSGSPWNMSNMPWGTPVPPPSLVQFTGLNSIAEVPKPAHAMKIKRKPLDLEVAVPPKQFISEEKMAAHLNGLHISSNYTSHSFASEDLMDVLPSVSTPSTSTSVSDKLKGHTIVLSEEIKRLQDEPLIPQSLIERLESPCMSLVVWTPKDSLLEKITEDKNKEKRKASESKNVMDVDM